MPAAVAITNGLGKQACGAGFGEKAMATFVLVHGAWHGAWCWRRVARLLARNGHEVFTPTLTGLAERSHLRTPDIDLDTHILDVVNEMKWQELNDVRAGRPFLRRHGDFRRRRENGKIDLVVCAARRVLPGDPGKPLIDLAPPPVRDSFFGRGARWRSDRPAALRRDVQCQRQGSRMGRCAMHAAAAQMRLAETDPHGSARAHREKGLYQSDRLPEPAVRSCARQSPRQGLAQP